MARPFLTYVSEIRLGGVGEVGSVVVEEGQALIGWRVEARRGDDRHGSVEHQFLLYICTSPSVLWTSCTTVSNM